MSQTKCVFASMAAGTYTEFNFCYKIFQIDFIRFAFFSLSLIVTFEFVFVFVFGQWVFIYFTCYIRTLICLIENDLFAFFTQLN